MAEKPQYAPHGDDSAFCGGVEMPTINRETPSPVPPGDILAIAGAAGAGLYVLEGGSLGYVNTRLANLLSYPEARELIGKNLPDLIHPDDHRLLPQEIPLITRQDTAVVRFIKQDGNFLPAVLSYGPVLFRGKKAVAGS